MRQSLQNIKAEVDNAGRISVAVAPSTLPSGVTIPITAQDVNFNGAEFRSAFTIPINQPVSNSVDLSAIRPRGGGIILTSAWDAADILFEGSLDNSNFVQVKDEIGTLLRLSSITTNAAFFYTFPPKLWSALAMPYLRLRSVAVSGTSNVNQTAARALVVVWSI